MPNQLGQPAYSLQSTCSWFKSKIFWEWIHQSCCVCVCLCVVQPVWTFYVCACHNEYVFTTPACCTHIPTSQNLHYSVSFIWAEPECNLSLSEATTSALDQPRGTLHLLEKPEARYLSTPCSQHIFFYHNAPQCAGSLTGGLWPFGGRFLFKNKNNLWTCICGFVFQHG